MNSWDLGAGFEDTYAIARRLIRQRLSQPTFNQQSLAALLERVEIDSPDPLTQQQVVALLSQLFTPEDWQTMAQAASQSISSRVLNASLAQANSSAA
jgi:L-asparaginase/Glu-tRNA(Gln) amidotransferase subunit D